MSFAIRVMGLEKQYEDFSLRNVNFQVEKGTIMGFIGENGSGKTTTIKAILNIIERDSGTVEILGAKLEEKEEEIKEEIGVVLSEGGFYEKLSIKAVGRIIKNIYKNWDEALYNDLLEKFKIVKKKKIRELSTGMKKKLYIALAMSHKPKLLILDEPTAGLDPVGRDEVLSVFQEYVENEENTIFISSHITTDLEKIADNIIFIKNGEIIFSRNKDSLLYEMGIAKCEKEKFKELKKDTYLFYRENTYSYELLVENKEKFEREHKDIIVDRADIESIMVFYVRGKK